MAFDKLKFWKKNDDDFFIDDSLKRPIEGVDDRFGSPASGSRDVPSDVPSMSSPQQDPFARPAPEQGRDFTVRDVSRQDSSSSSSARSNDELILAKLDAIKAMVENISRRLERIEEIALREERKDGY